MQNMDRSTARPSNRGEMNHIVVANNVFDGGFCVVKTHYGFPAFASPNPNTAQDFHCFATEV